MTRDLTSKKLKCVLYSPDADDITDQVIGAIAIPFSSLDQGICYKSCKLQLLGEQIDPELYPTRWAEGNKIEFYSINSTEDEVLIDTLRIIRKSYDNGNRGLDIPSTSPSLTLTLGCQLYLNNLYEPLSQSPRTWDGPVNLKTYINGWLEWGDMPTLGSGISLSELVGTLITYNGGQFANFIGQILYGQGRWHLWCDRNENLKIKRVELKPTSADLDAIATELAEYGSLNIAMEKPPGLVIVGGTAQWMKGRTNPANISVSKTIGAVTITETVSTTYTDNSTTFTRTGTVTTTGIDIGGIPNSSSNYEVTRVLTFNGPSTALSNDLTTTRIQIEGEGVSIGMQTSKTEETQYTYNQLTIQEMSKETKLASDSQMAIGENSLETDEVFIRRWDYEAVTGRYRYSERTIRPKSSTEPVIVNAPDNTDEIKPPATVFAVPRYAPVPTALESSKKFVAGSETEIKNRRTINLGQFTPLDFHVRDTIALEQGALMWGRESSKAIAWSWDDPWFEQDPEPFMIGFITEGDVQKVYLIDTVTKTLGNEASYIGGATIFLGIRNTTTGEITPPWSLIETTPERSLLLAYYKVLVTENGSQIVTEKGERLIYKSYIKTENNDFIKIE
ncbi:MAG: hypothetical protein WCD18_18400 [Thermosynechococcaceae cyanobacterium]